jgi:hypothetical protein
MRTRALLLVAAAALAVPAAASGHFGHRGVLAVLSGTGSSFTGASASASGSISLSLKLGAGTFSASISTDWTKATTRTGEHGTLKCAPATASLTLTGATASNTLKGSLSGKTCSWTRSSGSTVNGFFGRGAASGAGTLASLTGATARLFLAQQADGSVRGAAFAWRFGVR